ncbi:fimbria/pilus outer membrane usher protein, partial [Obesumbacterium proteus]|uniref:FimD/PapC N-terminal domain-containing protein n=1 Tax=Obesumbacterium proteus TaxID=82983 RepID=UPI001EDBB73E
TNLIFAESKLALSKLSIIITVALVSLYSNTVVAVEFNTAVLDSNDKANIDFTRFSQANYILPGTYRMDVRLNSQALNEFDVVYLPLPDKAETSEPCIPESMIRELGLKPDALTKITYWQSNTQLQCADISMLSGASARGDLATRSLQLNIPQAYLEYSDPNWTPPSRWDNGEPGVLFDYNLNSNYTKPQDGQQTQNASVSGTVGANAGPWRLRGDYQGSYNHSGAAGQATTRNLDWSRVYLFRALPQMRAVLTMGESYLASSLFDSWRFSGVSLNSDERMLPPSLRGYAP